MSHALLASKAGLRAPVAFSSGTSAFMGRFKLPVVRLQTLPSRSNVAVEVDCKLKTRKAAAKRFKVTGSGKVFARRCGKNHFNEKKTGDQLRKLSTMQEVKSTDMEKVIRCLPNHGIHK